MDMLLLAPLRVEAMALATSPSRPRVRRTGLGQDRTAVAVDNLATSGEMSAHNAVAMAGLGGGLAANLRVGDVVVAERVVSPDGVELARLPSAGLLVAELVARGLRARAGTVASTDQIVRGARRHRLAAVADVVDMESAALVTRASGPLAIVRAVSDTSEHELGGLSTLRNVGRALASLRACAPALATWASATGPREVLLAEPRSFCAGVRRAIETVERALARHGAPVYVRRQIVHNARVVAQLEAAGAVFVEELSDVPDGAVVVFSAHGVGTGVQAEAVERGMKAVDATCPLVTKVHHEARRFANAGRQVILIGHRGHDEVEGTLGSVPGITLVGGPGEAKVLGLDTGRPTAVVTQTTLTPDEVGDIMTELEGLFSDIAHPNASDICYASHNRQDAVRAMAPRCDLVLVVGSANSSNSNRLVEVARRSGVPAHLVDGPSDLRLAWLQQARRIGVTAGASAPEELVQDVVACLAGLGPLNVAAMATGSENVTFSLPLEVR